mmetsp:Transcript_1891/g.3872  ORF Transcript_1891/g.3872 Transcript_1891/m.3872 type:complete len:225 (-) Transcript_1891:280-954(-)
MPHHHHCASIHHHHHLYHPHSHRHHDHRTIPMECMISNEESILRLPRASSLPRSRQPVQLVADEAPHDCAVCHSTPLHEVSQIDPPKTSHRPPHALLDPQYQIQSGQHYPSYHCSVLHHPLHQRSAPVSLVVDHLSLHSLACTPQYSENHTKILSSLHALSSSSPAPQPSSQEISLSQQQAALQQQHETDQCQTMMDVYSLPPFPALRLSSSSHADISQIRIVP